MLVICYGIAKSGSTLAYELVRGVLMSAGYSQDKFDHGALKPRLGGNHMASLERAELESLIAAIGCENIVAAKTHKCFEDPDFPWMEDLQRHRKIQVVASYRDPRDMCLSLLDHGRRSREAGRRAFSGVRKISRAIEVIEKAIPKFAKWSSLEGSLRLYFETVAFAPDDAIDAIERALGVSCDHEEAKRHAFEDAFTQHNKGKKARYEEELSERESQAMLRTFGPFIERVCRENDETWFEEFRRRILSGADSSQTQAG